MGQREAPLGGGELPAAVHDVQLFAEVVEGKADNIQEIPVDILHQHTAEGLDAVATSLVPDTDRHAVNEQQQVLYNQYGNTEDMVPFAAKTVFRPLYYLVRLQ